MEQNPSAAFAAAFISAILGFGTSFYLKSKFQNSNHTKLQVLLIYIATLFLGYGLSGILGEVIHSLLTGLQIRLDKVMGYLIVNIAVVSFTFGILIWLLKPKTADTPHDSSVANTKVTNTESEFSNSNSAVVIEKETAAPKRTEQGLDTRFSGGLAETSALTSKPINHKSSLTKSDLTVIFDGNTDSTTAQMRQRMMVDMQIAEKKNAWVPFITALLILFIAILFFSITKTSKEVIKTESSQAMPSPSVAIEKEKPNFFNTDMTYEVNNCLPEFLNEENYQFTKLKTSIDDRTAVLFTDSEKIFLEPCFLNGTNFQCTSKFSEARIGKIIFDVVDMHLAYEVTGSENGVLLQVMKCKTQASTK